MNLNELDCRSFMECTDPRMTLRLADYEASEDRIAELFRSNPWAQWIVLPDGTAHKRKES